MAAGSTDAHLLQIADQVLVGQLLFLVVNLQVALVLAQADLSVLVQFVIDFQLELRLRLELSQIVLMLVQQVLDLLLHDLDLDLVPLFAVLHLSVLVAQLGLLLLQLSLGDLPEGVHFVALELKVVSLLALAVKLLAYLNNVLLQLDCNNRAQRTCEEAEQLEKKNKPHLFLGHFLGGDALDDGGRLGLLLSLSLALLSLAFLRRLKATGYCSFQFQISSLSLRRCDLPFWLFWRILVKINLSKQVGNSTTGHQI